jgi:PAS domain S-box-containing protein
LATQPASVTATLTVPLRGYRRALGTLVFDGVRLEAGEDLALLERAEELGRRLSNALDTTQLLAAVAASRRDLEELFDAIPDVLLVVDDSGSIVRVNRACADTVGVDAEALRRERLDSLISTDLLAWMQNSQESGNDDGRRFDEPRFGGAFAVTLRRVESEHGRKRLLICRRLSQ